MKLEIEIPEQKGSVGGWTVDFNFLQKINNRAEVMGEKELGACYMVGMEETELIIRALQEVANETKNP